MTTTHTTERDVSSRLNKASATLPNFSVVTQTSLSALIGAFTAAERALGTACDADEAIPHKQGSIKVLGGLTPASTITTDGKEPVIIPPSEWFYRSREEIEKSRERKLASAVQADRAQIEQRFAALLQEYDEQSEAIKRAVPKGKKAAERRLAKAHRALSAAEYEIIEFKPTSIRDATALLEFVSSASYAKSCFMPDETGFKTIMANVAAALRAAQ